MNKGTHFSGQPMYGQLINLLSKDEILKFSHNRNGERYVKHFDAYQHLAVMLYAVIKRFDSLREITDSMFPEARKLAHLGIGMMPRRSTLSDATPADLRQCLRTRTAVCMPDIKMNFPRTAESGKCLHGFIVCKSSIPLQYRCSPTSYSKALAGIPKQERRKAA